VQANVDGGETYVEADVFRIKVEMQKTIDITHEQ
jgi:hypothetical protein